MNDLPIQGCGIRLAIAAVAYIPLLLVSIVKKQSQLVVWQRHVHVHQTIFHRALQQSLRQGFPIPCILTQGYG